jgi:hypothetical protein
MIEHICEFACPNYTSDDSMYTKSHFFKAWIQRVINIRIYSNSNYTVIQNE